MTRCTFKQGNFNCGSYAFNLYKEDIDQGSYCDHHYWQDQAMKARADEREACAKVCDDFAVDAYNNDDVLYEQCAIAIRARSNT